MGHYSLTRESMPTANRAASVQAVSAATAAAAQIQGSRDISMSEIEIAVGKDAPRPLQLALSRARHANYAPHSVLYHQGSMSDALVFITGGLLKLITHMPNGRARIVRMHRPGSILGLSGLLALPHEHTTVALTRVTTLHLPMNVARQLRSEHPESYVTLVERWHDYLVEADTWITHFSTGPIRGRVARLLAFLSSFDPSLMRGYVHLLTCEEMGSILGVTGESVSRILAEFKRQRILARNENEAAEIYQTDIQRLQQIAYE